MTLEDPLQASCSSSDLQYYLKTQDNQLAYATQNSIIPNTASVFSNNFCCSSPAEDPQLIPPANPILFYINDMLMAEKMDQLQDLTSTASVDGTSCTSDLSWKDLHLERSVNDDWPVDDLLKELPLPDDGYLSQTRVQHMASNTSGLQVRQHPSLFPAQVSHGTSLNCGNLESWQIVAADGDKDCPSLGGAVPSMVAASPLPEVRSPQLVNLWNGITSESDFTTHTQCERETPLWISTSIWQVDASNMTDASHNIKIDARENKIGRQMAYPQPYIFPMVNITDCQLASAVPKAMISCESEPTQGISDARTDKRAITEQYTQPDMKHHVNTQTNFVDLTGSQLITHAAAGSGNCISNMKVWGVDTSSNCVDSVNIIRQHDTASPKVQVTNAVQKEQNADFDKLKGKLPTFVGKGQIDAKPVKVQENRIVDVTIHTTGSAKKKGATQTESDISAKAEARAALRRRRKMLAEKQKRKHMQACGMAHTGAHGTAMVWRRPDPLAATMITTMVDVRGLLVSCAEAVATNHTERAKEMLREIWRYASPTGSGTQRLAYYFGQGLEARMKGTGGEILQQQLLRSSSGVKDLDEAERVMRAYQTYVAVCPFLKLSYFYANEAILRMLLGADQSSSSNDNASMDDADGGKVVHIVDLNIMYGLQWPCFLKAVGERGKGKIKKVRITGVGVMSSYGCSRSYNQTGILGNIGIGSGLTTSSCYVNNESRISGCSYGGGLELMGGYIGSPSYNPGVGVMSSYNLYGTGGSKVGSNFGGLMYMNNSINEGGAAAAARCKIEGMKKQLAEAGRRVEEYARSYGVELEYKSVIAENWEGVTREALGVEPEEAETLVVNCIYRLRHLRDELEMQEGIPTGLNPREAVLARLRSLNPKLFVEGVVNGAYNAPFFMSRFKEALFHFSSMFDALDATVRQDLEERTVIEREIMGREILNVVACEGAERMERPDTYRRWQLRTQRVGFQPLPLDPLIKGAAQAIAHAFYHKDYGVENDENGHWLLLGWKGRMLHGISSWRPAAIH